LYTAIATPFLRGEGVGEGEAGEADGDEVGCDPLPAGAGADELNPPVSTAMPPTTRATTTAILPMPGLTASSYR
jgi:hypothetical protein